MSYAVKLLSFIAINIYIHIFIYSYLYGILTQFDMEQRLLSRFQVVHKSLEVICFYIFGITSELNLTSGCVCLFLCI